MNAVAQIDGYNPMRWECARRGCFNVHARPKVEMFARIFPGRVSMGDIDYEVELNGYHLRVEFKRFPGMIPTGQELTFKSLLEVPDKFTLLCVAMDCRTMQVTHVMEYAGPIQASWVRRDTRWLEWRFDQWQRKAVEAPRWRP